MGKASFNLNFQTLSPFFSGTTGIEGGFLRRCGNTGALSSLPAEPPPPVRFSKNHRQ